MPLPGAVLTHSAAMFTLFNAMMYGSHVHLFLTGRTTIESFGGRDQVEEEDRILQLEYGILWHNQEKRRVKRRWKAEYGGVSVDERWRSGTKRELWQIRMGRSWIEWLCENLCDGCWQSEAADRQCLSVVREVTAFTLIKIPILVRTENGSWSRIGQRSCNLDRFCRPIQLCPRYRYFSISSSCRCLPHRG